MILNEILKTVNRPKSSYLQPWMYQTENEIQGWVSKYEKINGWPGVLHIDENDLEIIANTDVTFQSSFDEDENYELFIRHGDDLLLPVQFKSCPEFNSYDIPITSLIGCPEIVTGNFIVDGCRISDFHGFPKVVKQSIRIESRTDIESFEGMPSKLTIKFNELIRIRCKYPAKIKSFHGISKSIEMLSVRSVDSFKGLEESSIHKLYVELGTDEKPGIGGVLSLLKCESLKEVSFIEGSQKAINALTIVNKHLKGERDLIACKKELISAGLGEFARL